MYHPGGYESDGSQGVSQGQGQHHQPTTEMTEEEAEAIAAYESYFLTERGKESESQSGIAGRFFVPRNLGWNSGREREWLPLIDKSSNAQGINSCNVGWLRGPC